MILRQTDSPHRRLTVPDHKEIAKGTLRAIIRQVGLTVKACATSARAPRAGTCESTTWGASPFLVPLLTAQPFSILFRQRRVDLHA